MTPPSAPRGFLRWPALRGDRLWFVADGSLWQQQGGCALQRLTDRALQAREPAPSPCGRWLAFSGRHGGAREPWVLDLHDGGARPLGAEALPLRVCGWHPDGRLLVALRGLRWPLAWTLRLVAPPDGAAEDLPLADAADGCFTSATRLVFVRGGLQDDHVRRYRGGAMRRLWQVDLAGSAEAEPIWAPSQRAGECWAPRFDGTHLHFLCDDEAAPGLWRSRPDGRDAACVLPEGEAPVGAYAVDGGTLVHAREGRLYRDRSPEPLDLPLAGDWPGLQPGWDQPALRRLEQALPHATQGALLRCRGRLWWLPPVAGAPGADPVALPLPAGRAGAMAWAADGQAAFAVSDASGEPEVWRVAPGAAPQRLTHDGGAARTGLWPSPCGRWLLHADAHHRLWLTALPAGAPQPLPLRDAAGPVETAAWLPGGEAFVTARAVGSADRLQLERWDRQGNAGFACAGVLGDPAYPGFSPVVSPDGQWLFYLCARRFEAPDPHPWGDRNFGIGFARRVVCDAVALVDGAAWPWDAPAPAFAGARPVQPAGTVRAVPLPADAHVRLFVSAAGLCTWVQAPGPAPRAGGLWRLAFGAEAAARHLPRAWQRFEQAGAVALAQPAGDDAPLLWLHPGSGTEDAACDALGAAWRVPTEPAVDWAQHARDALRHVREHLFDPALRGRDLHALQARVQAQLARVTERSEVDDVLAAMLAELGTLHSFVRPPAEPVAAAYIGVEAVADGGALRVVRVLRGSGTDPAVQGPAAAAGLHDGDRILAIGGEPVDGPLAAARRLAGTAGRRVLLTLARGGVFVQPHGLDDELALRHADAVRWRRAQVAAASGGRVGYLHLAAMRQPDLERFVRDAWADPAWRGLVLDLRGNRGGNIDSWLVDKLRRQPWAWWSRRHGPAAPNPPGSLPEPLAVLVDAHTYSDGETLAAALRHHGRGRLFGSRTSGAGVWLNQPPNLLDGGTVAVGEFGQFDAGGWLIEGHGLEPDVAVDIGPRAAAAGRDAVLSAALAWLHERIAALPAPPRPPFATVVP